MPILNKIQIGRCCQGQCRNGWSMLFAEGVICTHGSSSRRSFFVFDLLLALLLTLRTLRTLRRSAPQWSLTVVLSLMLVSQLGGRSRVGNSVAGLSQDRVILSLLWQRRREGEELEYILTNSNSSFAEDAGKLRKVQK